MDPMGMFTSLIEWKLLMIHQLPGALIHWCFSKKAFQTRWRNGDVASRAAKRAIQNGAESYSSDPLFFKLLILKESRFGSQDEIRSGDRNDHFKSYVFWFHAFNI